MAGALEGIRVLDLSEGIAGPYATALWGMSATPGRIRSPAPCLGEHSETVLREIAGLSEDVVEGLVSEGITGAPPSSPNR